MMEEDYDEAAIDAVFNLAPTSQALAEEIRQVCDVTTAHHPSISVPKHGAPLPTFTTYDEYKKALLDPRTGRPEHFNGSSQFLSWPEQTDVKIKTMTEFFEAVPWTNPKQLKLDCSPKAIDAAVKALPRFAALKDISKALRLNFWQHAVYETYARHLLYLFMLDIQEDDPASALANVEVPSNVTSTLLKKQLIGYMGGGAGAGKSAVISALLIFAQLWGRRDTIETMAFTGLASLNVDGNTVHSSRGLETFGFSFSGAESVVRKVRKVYLTIIDEVSMLGQKLCGAADAVTRHLRNCDWPWGGIHILLAGDFLQLPPVKGVSITKAPNDKNGESNYSWYLAAYELFQQCNYHVFLTDIMRQQDDPEFQEILERMHWGVNVQADLDVLNRRSLDHPEFNVEAHFSTYKSDVEDYFSPLAISTNRARCGFNIENIYSFAQKEERCVYEILADSSMMRNRALIQRLKYSDDDFTGKIPFLLSFHTLAMPAMVTKRIEELEPIKCIANGTLGFIVGFIHDGSDKACLSPDYVDDDTQFRVSITAAGVVVKRFKRNPAYLLFKVRGCKRQLVNDYPVGVVAIPLGRYQAKFKLPNAKAVTSMTVWTFPVIPAYAMTPEKLQGVTLDNELYVSVLDNRSPQILYVVFSRVRKLIYLILTERLTLEYVRKFLPPKEIILVMKSLIEKIVLPSYAPAEQRQQFAEWQSKQRLYAQAALDLHDFKIRSQMQLRALRKNLQK